MLVLIADGQELLLEILQSYLSDCGHEIEIAANGQEFFMVLRLFAPDVILLERELDGDDGHSLMARLQDNPAWSEIPVILTSTCDVRDESDEIVANPQVVAWLQEPFGLHELLAQINASRQRMPQRELMAGVN